MWCNASVHSAGGVTLENFFRRIPKQDTHDKPPPLLSSTAQQTGGASSAVETEDAGPSTLVIPGSVQKRVNMPSGYGHAGDSPEARRQRLLLAVQQRMEVMVRHFGSLHQCIYAGASVKVSQTADRVGKLLCALRNGAFFYSGPCQPNLVVMS